MGDGELLLTSSEDVRCFFYLVSDATTLAPLTWGLEGRSQQRASQKGIHWQSGWHLGESVYLPMGFVNSVAIAQHVHRRVIHQALGGEKHLARKRAGDSSVIGHQGYSSAPVSGSTLTTTTSSTKLIRRLAETLKGNSFSLELGSARETIPEAGFATTSLRRRSPRRCSAEVQGAWVDGESRPSFTQDGEGWPLREAGGGALCGRQGVSERIAGNVGGGFVYIAMFCRPLLVRVERSVAARDGVERVPGAPW